MALEDLTGTDKFISNLNSSWPVDDDWVDEGDNHIRGVKNVLKNTFPDTNAALHWGSAWARFPDGSAAAPGISWQGEPASGFVRANAGAFGTVVGGVAKWSWDATTFWLESPVQFRAGGTSIFTGNIVSNVTIAGAASPPGGRLTINGGFNGALASLSSASLFINSPAVAGMVPGVTLAIPSFVTWGMYVRESDGALCFGTNQAGGPTSLGGNSLVISPNGTVSGRSFNQVTAAVGDVEPLADVIRELAVRVAALESRLASS